MRRLIPLASATSGECGAKAVRLATAAQAGFSVLPGWVLPVTAGRAALACGAAAIRANGVAAGRRAVLGLPLDAALAGELRAAVRELGGCVIARSSSSLETDPRWAGAFSSVTGVGPDDIVAAVRSCWASAFALDPLRRLEACGLPPEAAQLAVLIQPEISPRAGGVARVAEPHGSSAEIIVEGILGHPGALLAGWAEGASARISGRTLRVGGGNELASLIGARTAEAVARLAYRVYQDLGDDTIEWAAWNGKVWLLQSLRSVRPPPPVARATGIPRAPAYGDAHPAADAGIAHTVAGSENLAGIAGTTLLAAVVQAEGQLVTGKPAAPGLAVGYLLACPPHQQVPHNPQPVILMVDRPLPAYAPLLYGVRGVIARTGSSGSHLAEIARSLGVPMVVGCPLGALAAPPLGAENWLAAVNGDAGDVWMLAV